MALAHTLFHPTTLRKAFDALGFVQADPIRSPARAQDLILRHRVQNYTVGNLEKEYSDLPIEEDFLYAYGFIPRGISNLWYPKKYAALSSFDKKVLEKIPPEGSFHPRVLTDHFGKKRVTNAWGGKSHATKKSLETLAYHGHIRVAGREKGIRLYERRHDVNQQLSIHERKKQIVQATIDILSPVTSKGLAEATYRVRRWLGETKTVIDELVKSGDVIMAKIDGLTYYWSHAIEHDYGQPTGVKFLAPFDPLVWDRHRFEHIWGWQYRFEAYTPVHKRVRGYYAMPLLFNSDIVGWANVSVVNRAIQVETGFSAKKPVGRKYQVSLEQEIEETKKFLKL